MSADDPILHPPRNLYLAKLSGKAHPQAKSQAFFSDYPTEFAYLLQLLLEGSVRNPARIITQNFSIIVKINSLRYGVFCRKQNKIKDAFLFFQTKFSPHFEINYFEVFAALFLTQFQIASNK